MKRIKISSKKLKNKSDPQFAKPHKEGAVVELVQPALDPKWGRYYFTQFQRSYTYLNDAVGYYEESIKLLSQCRSLSVDKTGNRMLTEELRNNLEVVSGKFIILTKLGLEYLTAEILPVIKRVNNHNGHKFDYNEEDELIIKIKLVLSGLGINEAIPDKIILILQRRDILEHPTQVRLYNMRDWKNNHLAWVLSGEIEGLPDKIVPFVNTITNRFEKYIKDNPIPGKLEGLQRGLKAEEAFKKPLS